MISKLIHLCVFIWIYGRTYYSSVWFFNCGRLNSATGQMVQQNTLYSTAKSIWITIPSMHIQLIIFFLLSTYVCLATLAKL